jgi:hypothetical protein
MSDLHLEINYPKYINSLEKLVPINIETSDVTLILAGDIGYPWDTYYWDFLYACSKRYKYVIFLLGNHEFYSYYTNNKMSMNSIIDYVTNKSKPENLYFLNNSKITIGEFTFLGSTLWSQIPEKYKYQVMSSINDYNYIIESIDNINNINKVSINTLNNINIQSKLWLQQEIINIENKNKIIVITHHLPSFDLINDKYKKFTSLNYAFASDLSELFLPNIKYWFYGHTHIPNDYLDKKTSIRFITNPYGYEDENNKFNLLQLEI